MSMKNINMHWNIPLSSLFDHCNGKTKSIHMCIWTHKCMMQLAMWVKFGMDMKLIHIDEIPNLSYPKLYWGDYTKTPLLCKHCKISIVKGEGEIYVQVMKIAIFISFVCVTSKVVNLLKEHDEISKSICLFSGQWQHGYSHSLHMDR